VKLSPEITSRSGSDTAETGSVAFAGTPPTSTVGLELCHATPAEFWALTWTNSLCPASAVVRE
jgi:hypothetical protein